jgi:predicted small lipoprotein YifL
MKKLIIISLTLALLLCVGCGKVGPLKLPPKDNPKEKPSHNHVSLQK